MKYIAAVQYVIVELKYCPIVKYKY